MQVLRTLRKGAFGEAQGKVMLTIGTRLPAELAENIVEYALIAEDLPSDPSRYEGSGCQGNCSDREPLCGLETVLALTCA